MSWLALLGAIVVPHAAGAQDAPAAPPATGPTGQATTKPAKPAPRNPIFEFNNHPRLNIGPIEIDFRARVQLDSRQSEAAISDVDTFDYDSARKRIGIEGAIASAVSFQIEREVGDVSDPWRDVYFDVTQIDQIRFRFGKFKLPFGLDQNTSATNNDFIVRSLASNLLSPGRDRGWMLHGRLVDRTLRYEFGVFEHDGRNARTNSGNRLTAGRTRTGRLSAQPFRTTNSLAEHLELGVAWSASPMGEGLSAIRGRTVLGESFFAADYPVNGERTRLGFEGRWHAGPLMVQSEYIRVLEERLDLSVEDTALPPLRARAWYVQTGWVVTGDEKADGLASPRRPLFQGGAGAIEVVARLERLTFDSAASGEDPSASPRANVIIGNSNRVVTLGLNWYVNRWIKIQVNFLRETFADPSQGPWPSSPDVSSRLVRLQFQL